jgi:hypothetical protein
MLRILAGLLVVAACQPTIAHSAPHWTRQTVVGLTCELIDPVRIENYSFTKDGLVAATLGTKKAITPPLWYWRIRDGRLQLSDADSIREEFTLLSMKNGVVTVRRRSGEVARFHYSFEHKRPNQSVELTGTPSYAHAFHD